MIIGDKLYEYFSAIGIPVEEGHADCFLQYALFWKLECKDLGLIRNTTFIEGWLKLGSIATLQDMKGRVQAMKVALKSDAKEFRNFYLWLYTVHTAVPREDGKVYPASIEYKTAVDIWKLLYPAFADTSQGTSFLEFISDKERDYMNISKDWWIQIGSETADS